MTKPKKHLRITPGGAFYLTQDQHEHKFKSALKKMMCLPYTPPLTTDVISDIFDEQDHLKLLQLIKECNREKLIQVVKNKQAIPEGDFELNLHTIIETFAQDRHVLLSDSQGFCLMNQGFPAAITEEISVLSADIAAMHQRRAVGINQVLNLDSQAWSIVDASGNSNLGFWPLNINHEIFVLVIEGKPFFNQPAFVDLIWILYLRYGCH